MTFTPPKLRQGRHNGDLVYLQLDREPRDCDRRVAVFNNSFDAEFFVNTVNECIRTWYGVDKILWIQWVACLADVCDYPDSQRRTSPLPWIEHDHLMRVTPEDVL